MKYIKEYNSYEKNLFDKINNKIEVFIASLIKDLEIKYDKKYPENMMFIHKETGEIWMEYNKYSEHFYVSYDHIWSKIEARYKYSDSKISSLIKSTVEFIFKVKVGTPQPDRNI